MDPYSNQAQCTKPASEQEGRAMNWARAKEHLITTEHEAASAAQALEHAKIAEKEAWEDLEDCAGRGSPRPPRQTHPMRDYPVAAPTTR